MRVHPWIIGRLAGAAAQADGAVGRAADRVADRVVNGTAPGVAASVIAGLVSGALVLLAGAPAAAQQGVERQLQSVLRLMDGHPEMHRYENGVERFLFAVHGLNLIFDHYPERAGAEEFCHLQLADMRGRPEATDIPTYVEQVGTAYFIPRCSDEQPRLKLPGRPARPLEEQENGRYEELVGLTLAAVRATRNYQKDRLEPSASMVPADHPDIVANRGAMRELADAMLAFEGTPRDEKGQRTFIYTSGDRNSWFQFSDDGGSMLDCLLEEEPAGEAYVLQDQGCDGLFERYVPSKEDQRLLNAHYGHSLLARKKLLDLKAIAEVAVAIFPASRPGTESGGAGSGAGAGATAAGEVDGELAAVAAEPSEPATKEVARTGGAEPGPALDRLLRLLRSEAESGDADAQFVVALYLQHAKPMIEGGAVDYARVAELYGRAAAQSHVGASFALARLLDQGLGVEQDPRRARELYAVAAKGGHAEAMGWLAASYLAIGDHSFSYIWASRAAEAGDPGGINVLGALHQKGWAAPKDYAKAMELFRRAADAGHCHALMNIGGLYYNGDGVRQDGKEAERWFREARSCRSEDAAFIAEYTDDFLGRIRSGQMPEPVHAVRPGRAEGLIVVAVMAAILMVATAGEPAGNNMALHGDPGSDWRDDWNDVINDWGMSILMDD